MRAKKKTAFFLFILKSDCLLRRKNINAPCPIGEFHFVNWFCCITFFLYISRWERLNELKNNNTYTLVYIIQRYFFFSLLVSGSDHIHHHLFVDNFIDLSFGIHCTSESRSVYDSHQPIKLLSLGRSFVYPRFQIPYASSLVAYKFYSLRNAIMKLLELNLFYFLTSLKWRQGIH